MHTGESVQGKWDLTNGASLHLAVQAEPDYDDGMVTPPYRPLPTATSDEAAPKANASGGEASGVDALALPPRRHLQPTNGCRWVVSVVDSTDKCWLTDQDVESAHSVRASRCCGHPLVIGRDPYSYQEWSFSDSDSEDDDPASSHGNGPVNCDNRHLNIYRITWRCNACQEEGRRRLVFSCRQCELDLCLPCALSRSSNGSMKYEGPFDEEETLLLGIPTRVNAQGSAFALVTWDKSLKDRLGYAPGKSMHIRDSLALWGAVTKVTCKSTGGGDVHQIKNQVVKWPS
jgi:hypothetical protein